MKKKIGIVALLLVCLTFGSYSYLNHSKDKPKEKEKTYYKSVVFKDNDNDLIPISVNFHNQVELEQDVRNRLDLMKSNELLNYGLKPIFHKDLKVNSVDLKKNILTIDFNDHLYTNQDAMDIIEALTYTMTDYKDVNQLQLKINGKVITHFPNSQIPVSSLTSELGLNNFEETSSLLHETRSVMVYNQKNIDNHSYYVPTTYRVNENDSLDQQVQTILSFISKKIHLMDTILEDGILTIVLDSNVLLDNEKIDHTLEDLIVLSLSSIENISDVKIEINGEDARSKKTSEINYNYIKI